MAETFRLRHPRCNDPAVVRGRGRRPPGAGLALASATSFPPCTTKALLTLVVGAVLIGSPDLRSSQVTSTFPSTIRIDCMLMRSPMSTEPAGLAAPFSLSTADT